MNTEFDPYAGNILTQNLGPILAPEEAVERQIRVPVIPQRIEDEPMYVRLHSLTELQNLHVPFFQSSQIYQSIDLMLRAGYRDRNPNNSHTWTTIAGRSVPPVSLRPPGKAAVEVGHSGVGKTQGILRSFECYPTQVIRHESFPKLIGPHYQMVFLSVDVPASGKLSDLARNLMVAWDNAMRLYVENYVNRFGADILSKDKGQAMMEEVRQVLLAHYLGVLHLDEVQNFFKLMPLKNRRKNVGEEYELTIVEEQCLREVLALINTWGIPIIFSGTPEGVGQLSRRFSNIQRFMSYGYHQIDRFEDWKDKEFVKLVEQLMRYQYVKEPLTNVDEVCVLLHRLSGGISRIIVTLWFAAHRYAFMENTDALTLEIIEKAAKRFLTPIKSAIDALKSGKAEEIARYDDLINTNSDVWQSIWNPAL